MTKSLIEVEKKSLGLPVVDGAFEIVRAQQK